MKKRVLLFVLLIAVSLISCQKGGVINPNVSIVIEGVTSNQNITLPQDGSLLLKVVVDNTANYEVTWSIDGYAVSEEETYKFVGTKVGKQQIKVNVRNHDGGSMLSSIEVNVYGRYRHGTFVLNEGNMTSEQGSLIFISPKGVVTDSVYWRANGTFIGNTAQDLFIANDKMYIISQNGGGDGLLVVANASTLKKEAGYSKDQLSSLSWPSHVAVVGNNAYIRDNKGVSLLDLTSKTLTLIKDSKGAAKNRMAVVSDKVFVPAGKNIFVIKGDQVIHTIEMPGVVSSVIKSSDGNIWASCTTSPAQISKIKSSDYTTIQTNMLPDAVKVGAGWGASPGISAKADTIYFSNATSKIHRHIFSQNKTEYLTDVKDHIADAGIVYSNLAVHPVTGEVYFNTIKGYGMDYLINNIAVFNFSKSSPVLKSDYKNYTHFPAGMFFTDNF